MNPTLAAIETSLSGYDLINQPMLNKGMAFTEEERDIFGLHGLLPPHLGGMEDQIKRRLRALDSLPAGFEQYAFLRDLQDTNETLFYALLAGNIERMLPLSGQDRIVGCDPERQAHGFDRCFRTAWSVYQRNGAGDDAIC